jgi:hypothetical protein
MVPHFFVAYSFEQPGHICELDCFGFHCGGGGGCGVGGCGVGGCGVGGCGVGGCGNLSESTYHLLHCKSYM